ncbi:MAG: hypothetical protein HY769_08285 [Candidatus Stahlbacteria bacterium]|nr:hypothetical protein [Candidatus Stahlbacteria bacterium]
MRTTIILEPEIEKKVHCFSATKKLSQFINQCIKEHFRKEERQHIKEQLVVAYKRANKEGEAIKDDFDYIETEGWTEW